MHIEDHHTLLDAFQIFVNADVPKGGKAILDINGTILSANDQNLVFSLKKDTLLSDLFPEIKREVSSERLKQFASNNKSIRRDVQFTERGVEYWLQLTISPIVTDAAFLFLVEFIDITYFKSAVVTAQKQRQRIEDELLLRTREIVQTNLFAKENGGFLTNFMIGLRHDLISPVVQLKDIIEYNRNTDDPRKKEQSTRLIDNCLEKLNHTARGFSNFVDLHILPHSKMESINMDEIFTEAKELLSDKISQSDATITTNFRSVDTIFFNKMITYSVVHNLLSNAIKFRRENTAPVIIIKTYREDSHFVFSVKDNGTGIDLLRYGTKLFVPFQRLHPNRLGIGVGLSMLKNTLVNYEGDIKIESIPGEGTTVRVFIPQVTDK